MTPVGGYEACLDGQVVSYCIKRSPRACRVRLEVRAETGLTVVVPRGYQLGGLPHLLQEKKRWILAKLAESARAKPAPRRALRHGDAVPYLGRELHVVQLDAGCLGVRLEGDKLAVGCRRLGDAALGFMVERWYRAQALNLITQKVDRLSGALGEEYCRITIRDQKTRWGSCSPKGSLSFNWKLLMAPEPVIDYVVIHELSHLREMNHGASFWRLVGEHCPQWREYRRWLRDHGSELAAGLCSHRLNCGDVIGPAAPGGGG